MHVILAMVLELGFLGYLPNLLLAAGAAKAQ